MIVGEIEAKSSPNAEFLNNFKEASPKLRFRALFRRFTGGVLNLGSIDFHGFSHQLFCMVSRQANNAKDGDMT